MNPDPRLDGFDLRRYDIYDDDRGIWDTELAIVRDGVFYKQVEFRDFEKDNFVFSFDL